MAPPVTDTLNRSCVLLVNWVSGKLCVLGHAFWLAYVAIVVHVAPPSYEISATTEPGALSWQYVYVSVAPVAVLRSAWRKMRSLALTALTLRQDPCGQFPAVTTKMFPPVAPPAAVSVSVQGELVQLTVPSEPPYVIVRKLSR
jgi:hypothetical protein